MPRCARIVIPGYPHHITHRGTNRQDIFFTEGDRDVYLDLLESEAKRSGLSIEGYCLMTNHIHFVGVPHHQTSLAKTLRLTQSVYAQYVNQSYARTGHLWENRFYSCVLDEEHYYRALLYAERNSVRAGLASFAWEYPWSSAATHVQCGQLNDVLDDRLWAANWTPEEWRKALQHDEDPVFCKAIRKNTLTGKPLGSDSFLIKLEEMLGMRLRPKPRGRPQQDKLAKLG